MRCATSRRPVWVLIERCLKGAMIGVAELFVWGPMESDVLAMVHQ
jgi:hypothetical protein